MSTGGRFAADVAALSIAAAVSPHVLATPRGVVIAALVLEVPLVVLLEAFARAASTKRAKSADPAEGIGYALFGCMSIAAGALWLIVGLLFADLATTGFDVPGFWPYVGTYALVYAASAAVHLPLRVGRAMTSKSNGTASPSRHQAEACGRPAFGRSRRIR